MADTLCKCGQTLDKHCGTQDKSRPTNYCIMSNCNKFEPASQPAGEGKYKTCTNQGKHYGTSHFNMCERCKEGLENGCADYKPASQPAVKIDLPLVELPILYKEGINETPIHGDIRQLQRDADQLVVNALRSKIKDLEAMMLTKEEAEEIVHSNTIGNTEAWLSAFGKLKSQTAGETTDEQVRREMRQDGEM